MTYQEFIKKNDSTKKVLFEIDLGVKLTNSNWIEFETGIWMLRYAWDNTELRDFSYGIGASGWGAYGSSSSDLQLPSSNKDQVFKLASVTVNVTGKLLRADSIESLREVSGAFYFDAGTQVLYIKSQSVDLPPNLAYDSIILGISKGFSNSGGYYGSLYYDGRVKSIPQITTNRDSLFYGKISFEGGSVSLVNTDGFFDSFGSEDYYGSEVRILFGGDDVDIAEYETVYTGYVEEYKYTSDQITINFKDNRKLLSTSIPINSFNRIDYPLITEGSLGNPIPLGYGVIKKSEAICIDDNLEEELEYNFKFVDTSLRSIKAINKVYVNNKSVTFSNPDLVNGTFTLEGWDGVDSYTVYEIGDDVTVDFHGYVKDDLTTLMENPIDIIQDILTSYTLINFNSAYFNLTDWEEARTLSTQSIGIWIGEKPKTIIDIIGDISSSILGLFVVEGNGKFSFNLRDIIKASSDIIKIDTMIKPSTVALPSKEYLNSVRVKYNRSWFSNKGTFHIDDSKKTELFATYRSDVEKEFETVLSLESDAINFATDALNTFGGVFPTYKIVTKTQFIELQVGDNIDLEVGQFDDELKTGKYIKCEVLGKSIDLNSFSITFTVRYIESITPDLNLIELIRYNSRSTYTKGSVVSSGGSIWRAVDITVGNPPEPSSDFWDDFGKLYWNDFTTYFKGDLVIYNSIMYQSKDENINKIPDISSEWIESGKLYWRSFTDYIVGDIVVHNGITYQSNSINLNKEPSVDPDWVESGKLNWRNFSDYIVGDLVIYNNIVWQSILLSTNQEPTTSSLYWVQYGKGTWLNNLEYVVGDLVSFGGSAWQSTQDGTNQEPSLVSSFWNQFLTSTGLPPNQLVTKILSSSTYSQVMWQTASGDIYAQGGTTNTCNSARGVGHQSKQGPTKVLFPRQETGIIVDAGLNGAVSHVLFDNGNLYVAGYNGQGQLGLGDVIRRNSFVLTSTNVKRVFASGGAAYTLEGVRTFIEKNDGTIWGAGYNNYGALGLGNNTNQTSWTQITALGTNQVRDLWNLGGTTGYTFAQYFDGRIFVTGSGDTGCLGTGSTANRNIFLDVTTNWGGTGQVTKFMGGIRGYDGSTTYNYATTYCLRDDGTVYGSGENGNGQLADGTTSDKSTPVQITGIGTVREMRVSGSAAWTTAFIINTDDELWRWGYNGRGLLGKGTTSAYTTPQHNGDSKDTNIDTFLIKDMNTAYDDQFVMNVFFKAKDGKIYTGGDGNSACIATVDVGDVSGNFQTDLSIYGETYLPSNIVEIDQSGHSDGGMFCVGRTSDGELYGWGYQGRYEIFPDVSLTHDMFLPKRILF